MRAVEYRESYALQDGKWYAGDSGVFAFMHDAKSAKLDAENPFRHAAAQLALLRALRTL
jgi:hypothetical protein